MELAIPLNPRSSDPLYAQLYEALRQKILSGLLPPGQKLPSTRALADSLNISRTTVSLSYEQLISEGYLEPSAGSGTYVSRQLPEELLQPENQVIHPASNFHSELSALGKKLAEQGIYDTPPHPGVVPFRHGRPDYTVFPLRTWRRILFRHCRTLQPEIMDYVSDSRGYLPLREAISKYLGRSRAVHCNADQIVIVNGSQQGLDLVARVLLNSKDRVAVEDPGYLGARVAFNAAGAVLQPVPLDDAGIQLVRLARLKNIRCLYVTPSHQFPGGQVLSLTRRLELLEWAKQNKVWIIEDDYDSEYRYEGKPIPALQGLDESASVIYVGTFSKVLYPALRIGYLVVPEILVPVFARAKWLADRQTPLLEQYALADFINEGYLERHIRKTRKLYNGRRKVLVEVLRKGFGEKVEIHGENAGMHILIRFKLKLSDTEIIRRAAENQITLNSAKSNYLKDAPSGEFIFGYANLTEQKIRDGVQKLVRCLL
ncbi:MAG TPA: PLP-dependent aminotransferase family protein [Acidobacteriota bacterium]|nr:PLP-dependent aminotransferase family protein [Acidobacteriota bacterium]